MVISLPAELKGMTFEERLLTYDWENQFKAFQDITLKGAFKAVCQIDNSMPKVINYIDYFANYILNVSFFLYRFLML